MSKIEATRYRACAPRTHSLSRRAAFATIVIILSFAAWASADILDDWAKVQPPPPPELKPVTLDGATLTVSGYVGSAPGQPLFAAARVELFQDGAAGQTYLGALTADGVASAAAYVFFASSSLNL